MNSILLITLIVFCAVFKVESEEYLVRDGLVYFVSYPLKVNWFQAMRRCAYNQMYLVDIQSPFENDRILSIINETEAKHNNPKASYWTSGNDLGHRMRFNWATTGAQIIYHYFDKGQPDNTRNKEHCVHLWSRALIRYKWNDVGCMDKMAFICRATFDMPIVMAKDKVGWANLDLIK